MQAAVLKKELESLKESHKKLTEHLKLYNLDIKKLETENYQLKKDKKDDKKVIKEENPDKKMQIKSLIDEYVR